MIKKFVKGKTAVFIDASNIYFSQKTLGWKIDFEKLLKYFKENTNLESLIKYLKKFGKRCITISTKGNVSIELIRKSKFIDFKKIRKKIELK